MILLDEYKDYLIDDQEKSQKTISQYVREIGVYEKWLAENYNQDLLTTTKKQIDEYVRYCRDTKGNKPLTLNAKIAALRSILGFYAERGLVEHNVANDVKSKKVVREDATFLTNQEVQILLHTVANDNRRGVGKLDRVRDYAIFRLFLATGLRSSELSNLTLGDIDFRTGKISVKHAKGNKYRSLILSEGVAKDLQKYIAIRDSFNPITDKLFVARGGKQYTPVTMGRKVKAYVALAGLDTDKIHTHTLRHTAATHTYAHSNDIVGVSKMLGHSDLRTSQMYTHLIDEKFKSTMLANPFA